MFNLGMMMRPAAAAAGAVEFVGGRTSGNGSANVAQTISLSGTLTGGLDTSPAEGDLVVVAHNVARGINYGSAGAILDPSAADYSYVVDLYPPNLFVGYKFMGSSPDASVTVRASGTTSFPTATVVLVFRGVDPADPIIGSVLTGGGTIPAAFESISPGVTNAMIVTLAAGSNVAANNAYDDPGDLDAFFSQVVNDSNDDAVIGGGYLMLPSGSVTPANWTGPAAGSYQRALLALRPV